MKFNEFMKTSRENQKYTQQKAADMIGVSLPTIQNWESGKNKPNDESLWREICKVYDLTLDEFLDYYTAQLKLEINNSEEHNKENEFKYKDLLPSDFDFNKLEVFNFNEVEQDIFFIISLANKKDIYFPMLYSKYNALTVIKTINKMKELGLIADINNDDDLYLTNNGYIVYSYIYENNKLFNIYDLSFNNFYDLIQSYYLNLKLIKKESIVMTWFTNIHTYDGIDLSDNNNKEILNEICEEILKDKEYINEEYYVKQENNYCTIYKPSDKLYNLLKKYYKDLTYDEINKI